MLLRACRPRARMPSEHMTFHQVQIVPIAEHMGRLFCAGMGMGIAMAMAMFCGRR